MNKLMAIMRKLKAKVLKLKKDESGIEFIEVIIFMIIAVLVGALILKIFEVSIPDMVSSIMNKIKAMFSI